MRVNADVKLIVGRRWWAVLLAVGTAGCSVGAPSWFSPGDRWAFPLVGPLEDGLLFTPAMVRGHGPYLFAIDPDANISAIDQQIVAEAGLRSGVGPQRIDETDTGRTRLYAELLDLKIANLTIGRRDAMVFPNGFFDTEGRHVNGIIGRDVIADSLVFGFDRDHGMAMLSTVKAFTAPPEAVAIRYDTISSESGAVAGKAPPPELISRGTLGSAVLDPAQAAVPNRLNGGELPSVNLAAVPPVQRRLATAQIGGASFAMHLDLGAVVSQLRAARWSQAQLVPTGVALRVVDEAATARDVTSAGVARQVVLGGATAGATFVPYVETRFVVDQVDGALGLDFFQPYAVYASWDSSTYLLKRRGDPAATLTARLGRWGSALACAHPGCITLELSDDGTLHATRDPEAAHRGLEVLIAVAPAAVQPGAPAGPAALQLLVELPADADSAAGALPAGYSGAVLSVLDASPFPRNCVGPIGCIRPLRPQAQGSVGEPLAHEAELKRVAIDKLHRRTGEPVIPPSDEAQQAAAGQRFAAVIVRICLATDGTVASTSITKSSGVAVYDEQLQAAIKATWAFDPVEVDGRPAPACTFATFKP